MESSVQKTSSIFEDNEHKIIRRSLHDEVVERLRDMIVGGVIEEGERLREKHLCERLGVSRTPLREALKVLTSEGLIELLPNRGARVTRLSISDLKDMFEVMSALENLAGELACRNITEEEIENIRKMQAAMSQYYFSDDFLNLFKIDQEIHKAIVVASRNETLKGIYDSLSGRMKRARFMGARRDAGQQSLMNDHVEMIDALSKGNGARLGRILRRHIRKKGAIAQTAIVNDVLPESNR